jgi:flagellar protein FliO/FliZ
MNTAHALALSLVLAAGAVSAAEPDAAAQQARAAQTPAPAMSAPPPIAPVAPAPAAAPVAPAVVAPAVVSGTAPAVAPATTAPSSTGSLLQVVFGLLVVVGLLAGALWLLKRMGGGRFAPGSVVKIVGGVSVGNRERVLVVEVADQWIVIGVAPGQVSTLASMPRQEQPAAQAAPGAPNFSAWLKQTIEKRNAN